MSVQESWLNGAPEVQDILVAFAGWMAEQKSRRKSERVKIKMAALKAEGVKPGGRKRGSKDKRPGDPEPYRKAWERRRAAATGEHDDRHVQ